MALPSTLVPESFATATETPNEKFCREHPGLCSPAQAAAAAAASKMSTFQSRTKASFKDYAKSARGMISDADPAKDKKKKQIVYGVGAAVIVAIAAGVGYYIYRKKIAVKH